MKPWTTTSIYLMDGETVAVRVISHSCVLLSHVDLWLFAARVEYLP